MANLLIVGAGGRLYREYFPANLKRAGHHLTFVNDEPPTWENAYASDWILTGLDEVTEVLRLVRTHHAKQPFDGILTYSEPHVPLAATISSELGLPGPSTEAAWNARDKHMMRRAFERNGVPCPKSVKVSSVHEAREAALQVGLPCVVKPSRGYASVGVVKVDSTAGLEEQYNVLAQTILDGRPCGEVLVEEYVAGPEFSIEGVIHRGEVLICNITKKIVGPEPYFLELGHIVPAQLDKRQSKLIREAATAAVKALGLDFCGFHAELRTPGGNPVLMEVAGRLGGDLIPVLVENALGVNLANAVAQCALDRRPDVSHATARVAGVRFFVPERAGVLRDVTGVSDAQLIRNVLGVLVAMRPGQTVTVPPDDYRVRLGGVIVLADTFDDVMGTLDTAVTTVGFVIGDQ